MAEKPHRSLDLHESPEELRVRTWVQLARTFSVVERRVATLVGKHGLTLPQFDVLATLRFGEGVTQQALARQLLVTKGNVCGLIDRLETLKWVERRTDAEDARANRLHLTAAGRRKIEAVLPAHHALVASIFDSVSDADLRAMRHALVSIDRRAVDG